MKPLTSQNKTFKGLKRSIDWKDLLRRFSQNKTFKGLKLGIISFIRLKFHVKIRPLRD